MALDEDLQRIAAEAARFAAPGEGIAAVLAAEPHPGDRAYLCAFSGADGDRRTWVALDAYGEPLASRTAVREVVSIAALCELAGDSAGGGDLDELHAQLVALRVTENPPGIDEAEDALLALQHAVGAPPRVATTGYLDTVGAAVRRLEQALGDDGSSPFAHAMKSAMGAVELLADEVEAAYKLELIA